MGGGSAGSDTSPSEPEACKQEASLSTEAEVQVNLLTDSKEISGIAISLLFQVMLSVPKMDSTEERKLYPERGGMVKTETLCCPGSRVQK